MNELVLKVKGILGKRTKVGVRIPYWLGVWIGYGFDLVARLMGAKFPISAIRVKKFCAGSVYTSAVDKTGFVPPVPLEEALQRTVRYEFMEDHRDMEVYYTE